MDYGKAIRILRGRKGMDQIKLIKRTGISQTSISLLETGKTRPTDATLEKIAEALEVERNYLDLVAVLCDESITPLQKEKMDELFPDLFNKIIALIE